jgi:hypothetical protein
MAYSTAYQQVIAGRVREDEQIKYFGKNEVTTPAGNFQVSRVGGSVQQPVVTKNQQNEYVGKQRPVTNLAATQAQIVAANAGNAIAETYNTGSNNVAKT